MNPLPWLRFWNSSIKFDHEINWKGFVFDVIRLEGYMNFLIGMFLQVLYLPSTTAVNTKDLEERFLRSFFSILYFQLLGTMTKFVSKFRVRNELWLKKLTEVSNYVKFICHIFGWDIVKIGNIVFSLVCGFKKMDCSRISSLCLRLVSLLLVKYRQGLSSCIKNPHCFVSVSLYV